MKKIFLVLIGVSLSLMADFTRDDTTGIVKDNSTMLEFKDDEVGSSKNWESAIAYCEGLTFGSYNDWRLPNINELESIIDDSRHEPSIDTTIFNNTISNGYWSATTYVDHSKAWSVGFRNGNSSSTSSKNDNLYVRCVRVGQ